MQQSLGAERPYITKTVDMLSGFQCKPQFSVHVIAVIMG